MFDPDSELVGCGRHHSGNRRGAVGQLDQFQAAPISRLGIENAQSGLELLQSSQEGQLYFSEALESLAELCETRC